MQGSINFKFGVVYAKDNQMSDEEFYSNSTSYGLNWEFFKIFCWRPLINSSSDDVNFYSGQSRELIWKEINTFHFHYTVSINTACCRDFVVEFM